MVSWVVVVKAVALVSLPSLVLLYSLSTTSHRQDQVEGGSCPPICKALKLLRAQHASLPTSFNLQAHISKISSASSANNLSVSLSPGDQSTTIDDHLHPSTSQDVFLDAIWQQDEARKTERDKNKSLRNILVTGSAGFIGYHVCRALTEQWKATVVGLDNFNDYYNVQLKEDRTSELIKLGVQVYRGDVCDSTLLSHLFSKYEFTDVVHLAAQAGVRHSLDQPLTFVHANVRCFLTLLDALTHQKVCHTANCLIAHYSQPMADPTFLSGRLP